MAQGGWEVEGYDDLTVLGRGGFATVYRARQLAFDRPVALKVLEAAATDDRTLQLFTRECRAAGALSWHPHVVPVYDAGQTSIGAPYLAMELLPGGTLDDALAASGPLEPAVALAHVVDIADALAAAHEEGLLHRDVKPANVLIDRRGRSRLTDFGIARVAGTGSMTSTGVVGTMAFMAPEVLGGAKATSASDVYALGLTLVTLIAGRNPFVVDTDDSPFAVIARVMAGERGVPEAVPGSLRPAIEALIATDPSRRPTDAAEAGELLSRIDAAPPGEERPRIDSPVQVTMPLASPPPIPTTEATATSAPPPTDRRPLVGPATMAALRVPPPPGSAVDVRSDHTLAVPPSPPGTADELIELDLSEWPWGLEVRFVEHLEALGIEHQHDVGLVTIERTMEAEVDAVVEVQLAAWADAQLAFTTRDRRLLQAARRAAEHLGDDTWDARAAAKVDEAARRVETMGAPDDVGHAEWRAVTVALAALDRHLDDEGSTDEQVSTAADRLARALGDAGIGARSRPAET